jgi:DNA replication protein DnaC
MISSSSHSQALLPNPDILILDRIEREAIGYIKQSAEEAEVLFTLIAQRYERHSVMITSNLVFSEWERIFKKPMAMAAAIDRMVRHAVILEFNAPSYRNGNRRRTDGQPGNNAGAHKSGSEDK